MKNIILYLFLLTSCFSFSQKIEGRWIGPKQNISEITVISKGNDGKGMSELLQFEFAIRGIDVKTQSNFNENTTINVETVKSKHALTFSYTYANGGWLYSLNVFIYDVENDGKLVGSFRWKGVKGAKKMAAKMVDKILQ